LTKKKNKHNTKPIQIRKPEGHRAWDKRQKKEKGNSTS
jgi:hypothetical protein